MADVALADSQKATIRRVHPRYTEYSDTWQNLGYVYEGNGPYLDGTALVPHTRETILKVDASGVPQIGEVAIERPKFTRRKAIARYENFARVIIDTVLDHQYQQTVQREVRGEKDHPLEQWWENVDGMGTHIGDWMKNAQTLAAVYGAIFVLMDKTGSPDPSTRAQEGDPVLKIYVPPDVPDWLAPGGRLTAVKMVEAIERSSLMDNSDSGSQYRLINNRSWEVRDEEGSLVTHGEHGFDELPVVQLFSRRRGHIPVVGQSMLRDPKVFQDHYNLVSELRELERSQTFSMLNIQLGEKETIRDARARLGEYASTETVLWTKGPADFIAPPDGPAEIYLKDISALERKMFRLVGLPYDNESKDAESAESRRLGAMDLNRILAGQADEAQRFEWAIARLWYKAKYGIEEGTRRFQDTDTIILHPDEFFVKETMDTIEEVDAAKKIGMGKTANAMVVKRALPVVLPDLDSESRDTISDEIDAVAEDEDNARRESLETVVEPEDKSIVSKRRQDKEATAKENRARERQSIGRLRR